MKRMVLSPWQSHLRVQLVYLMNVEQCQVAADPQTKPTDFTLRLLSSTSTIAIYYYSARKLILIYTVPQRVEG